MTQEEKKPFWKSKTKMGALAVGVGAILTTVGGFLSGSLDLNSAGLALLTEVGAVLAVFGIRDIPLLNKK